MQRDAMEIGVWWCMRRSLDQLIKAKVLNWDREDWKQVDPFNDPNDY